MKVNKGMLLVGLILGLLTVILLNRYINALTQSEEAAASSYVDVVVAANTIPEHVTIGEEMVVMASLPEAAIHPDAIRSLDDVVGGITRMEIINGEQVLSGRIVTEDIKATLSYEIPEGMRAITIPVGSVTGVANYVNIGDRVDILVTYSLEEGEEGEEDVGQEGTTTYTQLQNVEVLAIGGKRTSTGDENPESQEQTDTMTILVNPQQAEVVAFANINGQFHLTLRNPIDTDMNELEYFNFTNLESFRQR